MIDKDSSKQGKGKRSEGKVQEEKKKAADFDLLERICLSEWEVVRKNFYYPSLPDPIVRDDGSKLAYIDPLTQQISIDVSLSRDLKKNGLKPREFFNGILSHELNHYIYCPYDLKTMLLFEHKLMTVGAKINYSTMNLIRNYYMDIIIDLDLMLKKQHSALDRVYEAVDKDTRINKLIISYYEFQTGVDMNVDISDDSVLQRKLDELKVIDFLNEEMWLNNVTKFKNIVLDIIDEPAQDQKDGDGQKDQSQNQSGNSHGNGGFLDDFSTDAYGEQEFEKALKEVVDDIDDPQEFQDLVDRNSKRIRGAGPGGEYKETSRALKSYYKYWARSYALRIKKRHLQLSGSAYPYELKKFEIGSEVTDYDVWNSYGKLMPGISKRWKKNEHETYGSERSVPWVVIALDTSASMVNPFKHKSYATLGAFCVANAYYLNGAHVAVMNFSGASKITEFTQDMDKIYDELCIFQGQGTQFAIDKLEVLMGKAKRPCDLVIISDMELYNYDRALNHLNSIKNGNRITILKISTSNHSWRERMKRTDTRYSNISLYDVANEEDIPLIVLGEAERSFV